MNSGGEGSPKNKDLESGNMVMADKDKPQDEQFADDPLRPWEIKQVRKLLRDEERVKWFWSTIRLWLYYISAAVTFLFLVQEHLINFIKKVFK